MAVSINPGVGMAVTPGDLVVYGYDSLRPSFIEWTAAGPVEGELGFDGPISPPPGMPQMEVGNSCISSDMDWAFLFYNGIDVDGRIRSSWVRKYGLHPFELVSEFRLPFPADTYGTWNDNTFGTQSISTLNSPSISFAGGERFLATGSIDNGPPNNDYDFFMYLLDGTDCSIVKSWRTKSSYSLRGEGPDGDLILGNEDNEYFRLSRDGVLSKLERESNRYEVYRTLLGLTLSVVNTSSETSEIRMYANDLVSKTSSSISEDVFDEELGGILNVAGRWSVLYGFTVLKIRPFLPLDGDGATQISDAALVEPPHPEDSWNLMGDGLLYDPQTREFIFIDETGQYDQIYTVPGDGILIAAYSPPLNLPNIRGAAVETRRAFF